MTVSSVALAVALSCFGQAEATDAGAGRAWLEIRAQVQLPDGGMIAVGQPFVLSIEAEHPAGGIALLPANLPLPDALAERPRERKQTRSGSDRLEVDRYELELIAFEAGRFEIPPIPVALGSTTAETPTLSLEIGSGLDENEQLVATTTVPETAAAALEELDRMAADDPSTKPVLVPDYTLAFVGAGLLALFALGYLVLWLQRRARSAPAVESPPPPPRPAHEVALERLLELEHSDALDRSAFKDFHVELSEILREYVGARYAFDSLDLTVYELLDALRTIETPGLDRARLKRILDDADLVKFAKFTPTKTDSLEDLLAARRLVEETRAKPKGPEMEESESS